MFFGDYPEYPENALIFDFNRSDYLKPYQQQHFFKMVNRKFGNAIILRSFTLFANAFHEISFWLDETKVGTKAQRIIWRIARESQWSKINQMAVDLSDNLSKVFDLEIGVRIVDINKNGLEKED